MIENKLTAEFVKQFRQLPNVWIYKIPDMGSKNPFDCVACVNGNFVAIEFKKATGVLKEHQKENLQWVENAGGISLVGIFRKNPLCERTFDLSFYNKLAPSFPIIWYKGSYTNLDKITLLTTVAT